MHVLARSSSCATTVWPPNRCRERSSTTTRKHNTFGHRWVRCSNFPEGSHQQQLEERGGKCTPRNDAKLCPQHFSCYAIEFHVSGRLEKQQWQLQLPHWKVRAHCCVNQLVVCHMIEGFKWIIQDGCYRVPVRRGPFTPCCLLPDAPLDASRLRGPEETFCVPGFPHFSFDSSKLALHPHDGEQQPGGPHASSRLCDEDDSIAQCGPFAFLFNGHDDRSVPRSPDRVTRSAPLAVPRHAQVQ